MKTVLIWLLISVGEAGGNGSSATSVVERFATGDECSRVAALIRNGHQGRTPKLHCIEATVLKPTGSAS